MIQTKPFERIYSFLTVLSLSHLFTLCSSFSAFHVAQRTNAVHRSQYFGWDDTRIASQRLLTLLEAAKVGIFYGTSTGTTTDVAYRIAGKRYESSFSSRSFFLMLRDFLLVLVVL